MTGPGDRDAEGTRPIEARDPVPTAAAEPITAAPTSDPVAQLDTDAVPDGPRRPRRRILGAIGVLAAIVGVIGIKFVVGLLAGSVAVGAISSYFGPQWEKLPGDVRSAYAGRLQTAAGTRLDGLTVTAREILVDQWLRGGLLRLDDTRLMRRLDLQVEALGRADQAPCAAYGRQSVTGVQMGQDDRSKLFGSLQQASLVDWMGINVEAIEAELRGVPDAKRVDQTVVTAIIRKMAGGIAPAQLAVISKMNTGANVSDAEVCGAIRAFYQAESILDPQARAAVARFDVQPSTPGSPSPSPTP